MPIYRVVTGLTVEADDPKQAAQKAYVLHDELTPAEFIVFEEDGTSSDVELQPHEQEEALKLDAEGKLFPEEDDEDDEIGDPN